jgi:hypothetical protein
MCGALARASVNSDAVNQRSPNDVDPFHREVPEPQASRRKITSAAANAKKPTRSVESKAERVATAKTLMKADEPKVARVTKQSACSHC